MKSLRLQLESAGLSRFSPGQLMVAIIGMASFSASWVQLSFGVFGLSMFAFLAVAGFSLETLKIRATQRTDQLAKLWPEVIDSLQSAASSGLGIMDSLDEVARAGPLRLRSAFSQLVARIDSGFGINPSLDWFKSQFGQIEADRLIELIRVVQTSGGVGYLASLRDQAERTRAEIAVWGELESKQGWVTGTAKLAIIAPWIIVAILSSRPENVAIYNSDEGMKLLLFGLVVSLVAYRMVTLIGTLTKPRRVFTK